MIALANIIEAAERIAPIVHHTRLVFAPRMSELSGAKVFLKQENLQHTGAYKLRGAFNKIALMSESERARGVIAASAGNHAQGVAYSARHFGIRAVIFMPEATPLLKVSAVRRLGADVMLCGDNFDESYSAALEYAKEHELFFIHPFADDDVIAGQGTVGLEILREKSDMHTVILPVGGGGLISGVAALYKQMKPSVRVIGVCAQGAPAMFQSFQQRAIQRCTSVRTIADGIAVRDVNPKNFEYICESVDEMVCVNDEEIADAVLYLIENQKVVVEGAGAVGVAALLNGKIAFAQNENVVIVLSGGNIDVTMLGVIIEKGLLKSQRKMKFNVTLIDKPGSLKKLTDILTRVYANIVEINYDRTLTSLDYGDAIVTLTLETKGGAHQDAVREELQKHKFEIKELL